MGRFAGLKFHNLGVHFINSGAVNCSQKDREAKQYCSKGTIKQIACVSVEPADSLQELDPSNVLTAAWHPLTTPVCHLNWQVEDEAGIWGNLNRRLVDSELWALRVAQMYGKAPCYPRSTGFPKR